MNQQPVSDAARRLRGRRSARIQWSAGAVALPRTVAVRIVSLAGRVPSSIPIVVLIDESAFRARFEGTGKSGAVRIEERREAWRRMLAASDRIPVCADLAGLARDEVRDPLTDALQHALRRMNIASDR